MPKRIDWSFVIGCIIVIFVSHWLRIGLIEPVFNIQNGWGQAGTLLLTVLLVHTIYTFIESLIKKWWKGRETNV